MGLWWKLDKTFGRAKNVFHCFAKAAITSILNAHQAVPVLRETLGFGEFWINDRPRDGHKYLYPLTSMNFVK